MSGTNQNVFTQSSSIRISSDRSHCLSAEHGTTIRKEGHPFFCRQRTQPYFLTSLFSLLVLFSTYSCFSMLWNIIISKSVSRSQNVHFTHVRGGHLVIKEISTVDYNPQMRMVKPEKRLVVGQKGCVTIIIL
jgi:hypothetical protein